MEVRGRVELMGSEPLFCKDRAIVGKTEGSIQM